jgi:SAM-dependent methyltransferase
MMDTKQIDAQYIRTEQYADGTNLRARMSLHQRFSVNPQPFHCWVLDQLDLPDRSRILELGCGPGKLWQQNAGRIPAGWRLTLSDFSLGMVREARDGLGAVGAFSFANLDAQVLPFGDAVFDAVVANHMLYHVPDRPKAYGEIRRVLRPGGQFFAATNGRDSFRELRALIDGLGPIQAARPGLSFTLESGLDELAQVFPTVRLVRYEDALVVTEAEPLIAYVLSGVPLSDEARAQLERTIAQEIATHGAIRISKDTGLFLCRSED